MFGTCAFVNETSLVPFSWPSLGVHFLCLLAGFVNSLLISFHVAKSLGGDFICYIMVIL